MATDSLAFIFSLAALIVALNAWYVVNQLRTRLLAALKPTPERFSVSAWQYVGGEKLRPGQLLELSTRNHRSVDVAGENSELLLGTSAQSYDVGDVAPKVISIIAPRNFHTAKVIASEPFERGVRLYLSNAGRVAAHGTHHIGFAIEAAAAPDDYAEMLWYV